MSELDQYNLFHPIHPKPQPDELLSSWIYRTANLVGLSNFRFCKILVPGRAVVDRDIDNTGPPVIIERMAERTGTSVDRAVQTTLGAYEGYLFERHVPAGRSKWILRTSKLAQDWRIAGLQYCAACLHEDAKPYFRRVWRLALSPVCTKHGLVLLDRCGACSINAMPHRALELHRCFQCGFDLRRSAQHSAGFPALVLQRFINGALIRGWAILGETPFVRSHIYFELLHHVLRLLSTGRRSQDLRDAIAARWGGNPDPFKYPGTPRDIESLGVDERHRLIDLAGRVMEGWPFRFVGACAEASFWWSWAMKDLSSPPYAYRDIVDTYLRGEKHQPHGRKKKPCVIA